MKEDGRNDDKALFEQYWASQKKAAPAEPLSIDPIVLAAWIDCRLDDERTAMVDRLLAMEPALLDAALAAANPLPPAPISDELLARIKGLVFEELSEEATAQIEDKILVYRPRATRSGLTGRAGFWLSWAAVAASLMLVSVAGLGVGLTAGQSLTDPGEASHYSFSETIDSTSWMSDEVG